MNEPVTTEQLQVLYEELGLECGNCSARIMAAGGSLGSHGGLSTSDGDDLRLCGYCMGLELAATQRELAAAKDRYTDSFEQLNVSSLTELVDTYDRKIERLEEELAAAKDEAQRLRAVITRTIEATGIVRVNPSGDLADDFSNVMQAFISDHQNDVAVAKDEAKGLRAERDALKEVLKLHERAALATAAPVAAEFATPLFTDDQVASLTQYQECRRWHPMTCCGLPMQATPQGLKCSDCQHIQDWVHRFQIDWSWKNSLPSRQKAAAPVAAPKQEREPK